MILRPPKSTPTATPFPYTTLFRAKARRQRKHHRQQRIAKRQDGEHQPDHRIGKAYDDDVAPFVLEVVPSIGQRAAQIASRDVAYVYLRACERGLDMLC